jgi:predicted dehydrogenase
MNILLIGTGYMAREYAKVLNDLKISFDVVGRGKENSLAFKELNPGVSVFEGGIENFTSDKKYSHGIVTSNVDFLATHTKRLIDLKINDLLVEKPGGSNLEEIKKLAAFVKEKKARVIIAYNRRFYASVLKCRELIENDGGIKSFNFEFTEWLSSFENLPGDSIVKQNLLFANSTHVIDLAFYLGGFPREIKCYSSGKLDWHEKAMYAGAGISNKNALFCYHANWEAPGRWSVEMLTNKCRYVLRPMEQLQVQQLNSVRIEPVEIDDSLDKNFKPGLYRQVKTFLFDPGNPFLLSLDQQALNSDFYQQILKGN